MFELRDYQKEAVAATVTYFRRNSSPGVLVLPTGAGKSLVIAELARIARGRVLVLAHVKELVEQNHSKYENYGAKAGIYSAGLNRKEARDKVIFGSIQSVARATDAFFENFSLVIIDECHRVSLDDGTQYLQVIKNIKEKNPEVRVLGLTATPYRLGLGWIYEYSEKGILRSESTRFFKSCIYEVSLRRMIDRGFLTQVIQIDSPVAHYDFSTLYQKFQGRPFSQNDIEDLLKDQKRVTPIIIKNIVDMSSDRRGVMIFAGSVRHAREVLSLLPQDNAALVIGDTDDENRDEIIRRFKNQELKFLVNVSVLTTGFDAPHVDMIAIMRPTESVSLYQQIVGRGLRLFPGKTDCLVLDYTGAAYDLYRPEVDEPRPNEESEIVDVECPECGFINAFWGKKDSEGEVVEHYGRRCRGAARNDNGEIRQCPFRFRFKICDECGAENDIAAKQCNDCRGVLVDTDSKLRAAMALKDAHVMRPDSMHFISGTDKQGKPRLEVRYMDLDSNRLSEFFYLNTPNDFKVFHYKFVRMHNTLPERKLEFKKIDEVLASQLRFRKPLFVIARKQKHFWQIREKIFE